MSELSDADQFQVWLMHMDEAIAKFIELAPHEIQIKLDGGEESLDVLEAWILSKYGTPQEARSLSEAKFIDGASRYVGEIFRKRTGSKWSIDFSNPKFVYCGLPILKGGPKLGKMPECPITLITASIDRRAGSYLSTVLKSVAG